MGPQKVLKPALSGKRFRGYLSYSATCPAKLTFNNLNYFLCYL